jgi:branched-subunit amino acid transport protein
MTQTFSDTTLWIIIIGLAVGSFSLRFAFLGFVGDRPLPEWLLRHLRYTAVAIIPALITPLVLWPAATDGHADPARTAAAMVALTVGYWRKNVLWGVLAGGATLIGLLQLGL